MGYHKPARLDERPVLVERPVPAGPGRPIEAIGVTGLTGTADSTEVLGSAGTSGATAGIAVAGGSGSGAVSTVGAAHASSVAEPSGVSGTTETAAGGHAPGGPVARGPVAIFVGVSCDPFAVEPTGVSVSVATEATPGTDAVGWPIAYCIGAVHVPSCADQT